VLYGTNLIFRSENGLYHYVECGEHDERDVVVVVVAFFKIDFGRYY
jgi:hypothetical protein